MSESESDRALVELLQTAQHALLQHPVAGQAMLRALVREGRAYAETPDGAELRTKLAQSPAMRRGRLVWERMTLNLLQESAQPDEGMLPSALVDAVLAAAVHGDLEAILGQVHPAKR